MRRPPPSLVKNHIPCRQCKKPMETVAESKTEGKVTTERIEIVCKGCGYTYFSTASYGQQGD